MESILALAASPKAPSSILVSRLLLRLREVSEVADRKADERIRQMLLSFNWGKNTLW